MGSSTSVLYIASTRRSGTTLLGKVLGSIPGVVFAGEVRRIWNKALLENRLCGCGERLLDCPVWRDVLEEAFGGVDRARDLREDVLSSRPGPALFPLMAAGDDERVCARIPERRRRAIRRLYDALASVAGAETIVDTSELPMYGYQLDVDPDLDASVAQLVRDPRGVAFSSKKRKRHPDPDDEIYLSRFTARETAQEWFTRHAAAELLWAGEDDYVRLRYEDLAREPRTNVERVLDLLPIQSANDPFVDESVVQFEENHALWGNPIRMERGRVPIRLDQAWRRNLPPTDKAIVTSLTAPGLVRYGYPLVP